MMRRFTDRATIALVLILWGFGYLLVDITATLGGRTYFLGFMFLTNLPLYALGVGQSLGLLWLLTRTTSVSPWVRWPMMIGATVCAGAIQTFVDLHYLKLLAQTVVPDWRVWATNLGQHRLGPVLILYFWTFGLMFAITGTARANSLARYNEARANALEAAHQRAEASALRLQLNPHFMFNALNSVASLVVARRDDQAERMIGLLADFLRSSLNADPARDVTLEEELATLQAYLRIEEIRFGDRMTVVLDVDPETLTVMTPSFLLQPLAENAVKYGVAPFNHPVSIRVAARQEGGVLILTVENRAVGGGARAASSAAQADEHQVRHGIGLANTRQRLTIARSESAWLTALPLDDGFRAEIGLPPTEAQPKPGAVKPRRRKVVS